MACFIPKSQRLDYTHVRDQTAMPSETTWNCSTNERGMQARRPAAGLSQGTKLHRHAPKAKRSLLCRQLVSMTLLVPSGNTTELARNHVGYSNAFRN